MEESSLAALQSILDQQRQRVHLGGAVGNVLARRGAHPLQYSVAAVCDSRNVYLVMSLQLLSTVVVPDRHTFIHIIAFALSDYATSPGDTHGLGHVFVLFWSVGSAADGASVQLSWVAATALHPVTGTNTTVTAAPLAAVTVTDKRARTAESKTAWGVSACLRQDEVTAQLWAVSPGQGCEKQEESSLPRYDLGGYKTPASEAASALICSVAEVRFCF